MWQDICRRFPTQTLAARHPSRESGPLHQRYSRPTAVHGRARRAMAATTKMKLAMHSQPESYHGLKCIAVEARVSRPHHRADRTSVILLKRGREPTFGAGTTQLRGAGPSSNTNEVAPTTAAGYLCAAAHLRILQKELVARGTKRVAGLRSIEGALAGDSPECLAQASSQGKGATRPYPTRRPRGAGDRPRSTNRPASSYHRDCGLRRYRGAAGA